MKRVWEDMRIVIEYLMIGHMKYASDSFCLVPRDRIGLIEWSLQRQVSFQLKGDLFNSQKHPRVRIN